MTRFGVLRCLDQPNQPSLLLRALQGTSASQQAAKWYFPSELTPFASYSGVWTFGPLGADIGWVQDSQFQFNLWGRMFAFCYGKIIT